MPPRSRSLRCRNRLPSQISVQAHIGFSQPEAPGSWVKASKISHWGVGAVGRLDTLGQRYYSPSTLAREQGALNRVVHGCTGMPRLDGCLKYVLVLL